MAIAHDWFQCSACGRRQRWRVEIAGTSVECRCGAMVDCPPGPTLSTPAEAAGAEDTLIESADAPSSASPILTDEDLASIAMVETPGRVPLSPAAQAVSRRATKRFLIWTVMMLLGVAMLIHAIVTEFWWYIALAVLIAPLSGWRFFKAKARWQGNRRFWRAVAESVGSDE